MNQSELLYMILLIRQPAFLGFPLSTLSHEVCLRVFPSLYKSMQEIQVLETIFTNVHIDLTIASAMVMLSAQVGHAVYVELL